MHTYQAYEYVAVGVAFQVPTSAVTTCPAIAVPEIVGGDELTGGPVIWAVVADQLEITPDVLVSVCSTEI